MDEKINEIVDKCLDDWFQLWVKAGFNFIKTLELDWDIQSIEDILEKYKKQFNLVKNENAN